MEKLVVFEDTIRRFFFPFAIEMWLGHDHSACTNAKPKAVSFSGHSTQEQIPIHLTETGIMFYMISVILPAYNDDICFPLNTFELFYVPHLQILWD